MNITSLLQCPWSSGWKIPNPRTIIWEVACNHMKFSKQYVWLSLFAACQRHSLHLIHSLTSMDRQFTMQATVHIQNHYVKYINTRQDITSGAFQNVPVAPLKQTIQLPVQSSHFLSHYSSSCLYWIGSLRGCREMAVSTLSAETLSKELGLYTDLLWDNELTALLITSLTDINGPWKGKAFSGLLSIFHVHCDQPIFFRGGENDDV